MFLNNRYHDPQLGHFITVDPLVGTTGTPYLYANGNPSTLSDPNGLCATFSSVKGSDGVWRGGSHDDGKGPCGGGATPPGKITVQHVPVEPHFVGPYFPAVPPGDQGDLPGRGGWAVSPWVYQSAMGCVEHSSPALNGDGCWVAGSLDTGALGKWGMDNLVPGDAQALECSAGGNTAASCALYLLNSREAISMRNMLVGSGELSEDQGNAFMHAYWFTLNRYDTLAGDGTEPGLAVDDGNLRSFGRAHEADWRDSWLDTERDYTNNAMGVAMGRSAYEGGVQRNDLVTVVLANMGSLNCISGDIAMGVPVRCS